MKRGFTLVELLAVITILAIIALIATPIVLDIIEDSKKQSYIISAENYVRAVEQALYSENLEDEFTPSECIVIKNGNIKCGEKEIKVNVSGNKPKEGTLLLNDNEVKKSLNLQYDEKVYVNKELGEDYYIEDEYIPVAEVYEGLYPVIYDEEEKLWKIVDEYSKWYDYKKQEWANAVILNKGVEKQIGDVLDIEKEVKAMMVFIPRFSYTMYSKNGISPENGSSTPNIIDIKFIAQNDKDIEIPVYTTSTIENWYTHPAFTFGDKELKGIWVGKFRGGFENNDFNALDNTVVKPYHTRDHRNTENNYYSALTYNEYISMGDAHMAKNTEYMAIMYLYKSKYGKYGNPSYDEKNKGIYNPPLGDRTEGRSSDSLGNVCSYDDIEDRGDGTGSCGGGGSTTGNITGVYNSNWNHMMATIIDDDGLPQIDGISGFTKETLPSDSKYYDSYTSNIVEDACGGKICYGHGFFLTSIIGRESNKATFLERKIESTFFRSTFRGSGMDHTSFRLVIS